MKAVCVERGCTLLDVHLNTGLIWCGQCEMLLSIVVYEISLTVIGISKGTREKVVASGNPT
jgi:hypothetical protein